MNKKWVNIKDGIIIYWLIRYKSFVHNLSFDGFLTFVDKGLAGNLLLYLVNGYPEIDLAWIYELTKKRKCPEFKTNFKIDSYFNWPYNEQIERIYKEEKI